MRRSFALASSLGWSLWALGLSLGFAAALGSACGDDPALEIVLVEPQITIAAGASATQEVLLRREGGLDEPVALTLTGAPAGVTAAFTHNPANGDRTTMAIMVASSVAPGRYDLALEGQADGVRASAPLTLDVTPP